MTTDPRDLVHLRRCVALAAEAIETGDGPFGSVLTGPDGEVLAEERNRETSTDDPIAHPELALAQWAAKHLPPGQRAATTVYTSGEHCPMCAAAHAWVGLGRIVYAASSAQLAGWRSGWGLPGAPVAVLPISVIAPGIPTVGPVAPFDEQMRELHERSVSR